MDFKAEATAKAAYERLEADVTSCGDDRRDDRDKQADREILGRWRSAKAELDRTIKDRGARYQGCSFDNFEVNSEDQQKVVDALSIYAANAIDNLALGRNVLLYGPRGTGKDHLLIALAKVVFRQTAEAFHWENGVEWFEHLRQSAIGQSKRPGQVLNYWQIRMLNQGQLLGNQDSIEEECPIFVLSDPLPPSGALSEFQQTNLFRVIDARYSNLRPTWMSLNVADGAECERRLGAQTADRLRHGALALHCNWESHRKAAS